MSTQCEISRIELEKFKEQYAVEHSIGDLTPTVCELNGIAVPVNCGATALASVVDHAAKIFDGEAKNQRTFIYCADAVGEVHYQRHKDLLRRVNHLAGFKMLSSCVMPSVTPVCFSTIFSGSSPEIHGIRKWEQPVVTVETLFDVFAEAGKNVALVARNNCSMDRIFRKREIDYYTTRNDDISREITRHLIKDNSYDLIVSYAYNFDALSHKTGPESNESIFALTRIVENFEFFCAEIDRHWRKYNRTVIFAADHGNHSVDEKSGAHGENIPDDMLVNHFYRLRAKS